MPTKVQHTYLVLFKGDDSDFIGNQNIVLNLETDLDLTGCKAHFKFLDFAQDFTEIPDSKQLELVFPKAQTAKFPLGAMDAELWLEDSEGKRRTVSNRIHIVVTNSVPEAYNNEDTQAITVVISGEVDMVDIVPPSTDPEDEGKAADAYATGNALSGKLSKAEAEAGFTEWVCEPATYNGKTLHVVHGSGEWLLYADKTFLDPPEPGDDTVTNLTFSVYGVTATRTRLPTMADITALQNGKANKSELTITDVSGDATKKTVQLKTGTSQNVVVEHQQLTPVFSHTPTFSEWALSPEPPVSGTISIVWSDEEWLFLVDGVSVAPNIIPGAGQSAIYLEFQGDIFGLSTNIFATRTRTDIVGYKLGNQTPHLQPQGNYAPATNIPKDALASDVQTSLGKADTAVQPSELADYATISALRYDLVQTITLGQLQDRAVQKVTLNAASTTIVLPSLTDLTGKVSDFGFDVINSYEDSGTPAAASFQLAGTLGTDYNLIVPKGETWSDMTALAAGEMAVYYFTLSAFQIDDLPTWEVTKKVVELVPVPTAP